MPFLWNHVVWQVVILWYEISSFILFLHLVILKLYFLLWIPCIKVRVIVTAPYIVVLKSILGIEVWYINECLILANLFTRQWCFWSFLSTLSCSFDTIRCLASLLRNWLGSFRCISISTDIRSDTWWKYTRSFISSCMLLLTAFLWWTLHFALTTLRWMKSFALSEEFVYQVIFLVSAAATTFLWRFLMIVALMAFSTFCTSFTTAIWARESIFHIFIKLISAVVSHIVMGLMISHTC